MKHIIRCIIAGMVAILPIGGTLLAISFVEISIASSGIGKLSFYFPGLGIILALSLVYFLGLMVTTYIGKFFYSFVDQTLEKIPGLGFLYNSLKELLGYGEEEEALFSKVVLVDAKFFGGKCLGLVTKEILLDDINTSIVYIPNAPSPTTGKLHYIETKGLLEVDMTTNDALKVLFSIGKIDAKYEILKKDNWLKFDMSEK